MNINEEIKSAIINGKPMSFGKMGNVESFHLKNYLSGHNIVNGQLFVNAGIHAPTIEDYAAWCSEYLSAVQNLDYILQWHPSDQQFVEHMFPKERIFTSFEGLEPFMLGEEGWQYSLHDKKVLCVSPFPETVQMQTDKFGKIWKGAQIGEVVTVRSPYSEALTGEPPISWQHKFRDMIKEIYELDFDFATVGCGGFSLMVCDYIKRLGKPSVHLGGGNQILYGIRGKRWDEGFKQHRWYGTEDWIRPLPHEVPPMKNFVEGGCYW